MVFREEEAMKRDFMKRVLVMSFAAALFIVLPWAVVLADDSQDNSVVAENDESYVGIALGEDSSEVDRAELELDGDEETGTPNNDESVADSDGDISAEKSEAALGTELSEAEDIAVVLESSDDEDEIDVGSSGALTSEQTIPIYRLFNPRTGEHFYTPNAQERNNCVGWGWNAEGIAWYSPKTSNKPVYRVMNPNNYSEHHYTMSVKERDWLVSLGWRNEGIAFYSSEEGVPVYRHYHPIQRTGNHHYTTSSGESNHIVKYEGWNYEGVCWKVSKAGGSEETPSSGGKISYNRYNHPNWFETKQYWKRGDGKYVCRVSGQTGDDLTIEFSDGVYLAGRYCYYEIQNDNSIRYSYKKGWSVTYNSKDNTLLSSCDPNLTQSRNQGYYYPISRAEYDAFR